MKRKMMVFLSLLMVLCMIPLSSLAGLYWGDIVRITSKSAVNVYSGPGRDYKFIGEAMSTNTYDCLGRTGDWYWIQFTSDKQGYVPTKYSALETGLVWRSGSGEVEAVVRNTHYNTLNVRNKPDKDSSVIGEMKPDTTLEYCGTENGWNRVLYRGDYAYVAGNRTTIEVVDTITEPTSEGEFCYDCYGTGYCYVCDGLGIIYNRSTGYSMTCPTCDGEEICWTCGGDGVF